MINAHYLHDDNATKPLRLMRVQLMLSAAEATYYSSVVVVNVGRALNVSCAQLVVGHILT